MAGCITLIYWYFIASYYIVLHQHIGMVGKNCSRKEHPMISNVLVAFLSPNLQDFLQGHLSEPSTPSSGSVKIMPHWPHCQYPSIVAIPDAWLVLAASILLLTFGILVYSFIQLSKLPTASLFTQKSWFPRSALQYHCLANGACWIPAPSVPQDLITITARHTSKP